MLKLRNISKICISAFVASFVVSNVARARDAAPSQNDVDVDLSSAFVHSECDEMRSVALDYDPMYTEIDGETGMFFPMPLARLVLCDVEEKAGYSAQLVLMETELELWSQQEDLRADQVEAMQGVIDFMHDDAATLREQLRRSEARALHWTRHPVLWFGVGILVSVAAVSLASAVF